MSKYLKLVRGERVICQILEPSRPYENLEDCRRNYCHYGKGEIEKDPTFYPCLYCSGAGWIYTPGSSPDVVDGNKDRPRQTCQICKGSRKGTKEVVAEHYKQSILKWEAEKKRVLNKVAKIGAALYKLSDTEVDLLLKWIGRNDYNHYDRHPTFEVLEA